MLVAFVSVSYFQINKAIDALDRADTSNVHTRRSIEIAEKNIINF
jgi:hypothetical protein